MCGEEPRRWLAEFVELLGEDELSLFGNAEPVFLTTMQQTNFVGRTEEVGRQQHPRRTLRARRFRIRGWNCLVHAIVFNEIKSQLQQL